MLTANTYYKSRFHGKVYRISLNGGMTCPNRDGTLDNRGCIFCSSGGSGDFAASAALSVPEQIRVAKEKVAAKLPKNPEDFAGYLAYFQAFTNTYAPVSYLRTIFTEALSEPQVIGLSVATRPDCLSDECIALLSELQKSYQKPIYIELGLQTIHEASASFIRRGYPLATYDNAVSRLTSAGLPVITHVILGLPHETFADMKETVSYLVSGPQKVHGLKLQLLHILEGTDLADYFRSADPNVFACLTLDRYVALLKELLPLIPDDVVIYRITGDGPKKDLIAPLWSANKKSVLNTLHANGIC